MAVNYMEDGTRSAPAPINAFHKSPSAIIGHGDTMVLPDAPATVFEGEAEMAVIIGKKCSHVSEAEAMDYVFGYMNFVDGSARGLPPPGNVFFQMKSRDTFAPIGPYLVTADEIKNPLKLQIRLWNNGVLMQDFNTDDMGHKISKCIAWLSSIHTLLPGDIVATGTNHRGLNPFMDGDTIELETEGLGRLKFGVSDDLKRSWARKTRLQGPAPSCAIGLRRCFWAPRQPSPTSIIRPKSSSTRACRPRPTTTAWGRRRGQAGSRSSTASCR